MHLSDYHNRLNQLQMNDELDITIARVRERKIDEHRVQLRLSPEPVLKRTLNANENCRVLLAFARASKTHVKMYVRDIAWFEGG